MTPGYPSPAETTWDLADEALCPQHVAAALLADNYVNVPVPRADAAYVKVNARSRGHQLKEPPHPPMHRLSVLMPRPPEDHTSSSYGLRTPAAAAENAPSSCASPRPRCNFESEMKDVGRTVAGADLASPHPSARGRAPTLSRAASPELVHRCFHSIW